MPRPRARAFAPRGSSSLGEMIGPLRRLGSPAGDCVSSNKPGWIRLLAAVLCAGMGGGPALAQTVCEFLYPAGAQVGTTVTVRLTGRLSAWPLAVWCEDPGLQFHAAEAPGYFAVTLATNTTPGAHLIRFCDPTGASGPCQFVAGEFPELLWPESPDTHTAAHETPVPATPPLTVQGRLEANAPGHVWPLALPGPATLRLEAVASRLDSPGTVRLAIRDATGALLNRSTNAPPTDPLLECQVPSPGTYTLEVTPEADSLAPAVRSVFPPIVYRVTITTHSPARPAMPSPASAALEGAPLPDAPPRMVIREIPSPTQPMLHPEMLSPSSDLVGTFGGFINPVGDQDRYGFQARREQIHRVRARALNPDSAFVPVLRVLDPAGTVLAESVPGAETVLEWTAPADGAYVLAVADALDAGGPDYGYEIEVAPPQPHITATAPEHTFRLAPGGRLVLPVEVRRPDTARTLLTVTTHGLPAEVMTGSAILTPDAERVGIELHAVEGARLFSGPFRVLLLDPTRALPVTFPVTAPVRGRHAPPGGLLINETEVFWLSVGRP